jgi:nucleoside-diphosphate-sugar epimerase
VGGLGYLGVKLIENIGKIIPNANIIVYDTGWFKHTNLENIDENLYEYFYLDKRDIDEERLKNVDVVIDLAAVSNDVMGNNFETATNEINFKSTVDLAKKCLKYEVKKFIFASSCSIYGTADDEARIEDSEVLPLTAYSKSKWNTEIDLRKLNKNKTKFFALRFSTACGWSPSFRADLVLNDFVISSVFNNKILVLSDGSPWRPLISTNDISRSIIWAILENKCDLGFNYYNVGSDEWTFSIKDLAIKVSEIAKVEYEIIGKGERDKRSYKVNFDKFLSDANDFAPNEKFNDVVFEMLDKVKFHKEKINKVGINQFKRLNVLKDLISKSKINKNLFWIN